LGAKYSVALPFFDAVDLAIGRGAGVDRAAAVHGDGEDSRAARRSTAASFAGAVDAIHPAAVAGAGVERSIGASATLQITGWSEVKTVSILGASERRPSRLSEMPLKRPRTKSPYESSPRPGGAAGERAGASAAHKAAARAK
jgi:hypothetical protein